MLKTPLLHDDRIGYETFVSCDAGVVYILRY